MTTQIQRRRGTTTQHGSFTGAVGEITIDTTKDTVVVHDGSTVGGHPLAKENNPTFTGNMGIGTASPGTQLEIAGSASTLLRLDSSNGSGGVIRIRNSGTDTHYFGSAADFITGGAANQTAIRSNSSILFGISGNEKVRIDSSGRVGIGTSSPSQSLTLRGEQFIETNSTAADSGNGIYWQSTTSGWATSGAHAAIYGKRVNGSNGYLRFDTRSSGTTAERMRIDSSGNVGIGTASPGQLLHLSSSGPRILLTQTSANSNAFLDAATSGVLELSADDNNVAASSSMRFKVDGSEKLRIDSSGNVGIATTAPQANLDISPASSSATLRVQARTTSSPVPAIELVRGTAQTFGADVYQDFRIKDSAGELIVEYGQNGNITEALRVDSVGNVGVGTASADANLHIKGGFPTVHIERDSAVNYSRLLLDNTANDGGAIDGIGDGVGGLRFLTSDAGTIAERVRIDSSGRLLLGTTTEGEATADNFTIADSGHCGVTLRSGTGSVGTIFLL